MGYNITRLRSSAVRVSADGAVPADLAGGAADPLGPATGLVADVDRPAGGAVVLDAAEEVGGALALGDGQAVGATVEGVHAAELALLAVAAADPVALGVADGPAPAGGGGVVALVGAGGADAALGGGDAGRGGGREGGDGEEDGGEEGLHFVWWWWFVRGGLFCLRKSRGVVRWVCCERWLEDVNADTASIPFLLRMGGWTTSLYTGGC